MLLLSPVAVSATILRRRETIGLILLVAGCVTFLSLFNYPLPLEDIDGTEANLYLLGLWMAMVRRRVRRHLRVVGGVQGAPPRRGVLEARLSWQRNSRQWRSARSPRRPRTGSARPNTITVIAHELSGVIHKDDPIYDDVRLLRAEANVAVIPRTTTTSPPSRWICKHPYRCRP